MLCYSDTLVYIYRIPLIALNNIQITWSPMVKYLDVTIGRRMNFGAHVTETIKKNIEDLRYALPSSLQEKSTPTVTATIVIKEFALFLETAPLTN